jgi:hypothetical protein
MNKMMLVFAPVLAAGIMFGVSGGNFLKPGIPEELPEKVEVYNLQAKGEALLMKQIIEPIQGKKRQTKSQMFSRCPSGVSHYVSSVPNEENGYFLGRVTDWVGCNSAVVCYFRIDRQEESLEVKSQESDENYMSVAEWKKSGEAKQWSF